MSALAFDCDHANEVPSACPCPPACYCKDKTCAPRCASFPVSFPPKPASSAALAWPGDLSASDVLPPKAPALLRQTLWIAGRFPGLNEVIAAAKGAAGRGTAYAKMKRDLGELVWATAKAARLKPVKRARLHFLWVEKDRRRDPDNVSSAGRKFILDGLVKAGVLPGDGWAAIESWSDTFSVDARHGVAVTIQEVDGG